MTALPVPTDVHDELAPLGGLIAGWMLGYSNAYTRTAYGRDMRQWCAWCDEHDVDVVAAQRAHIDAWLRTQEQADARPASLARRLATLRSFYDYLEADVGIIARSPARRVRTPRPDPNDEHRYRFFPLEQLRAIGVEAAEDGPDFEMGFRLLALNGLRISEATRLRASDVVTLHDGTRMALVTGKGGKRRPTLFVGRTATLVDIAVAARRTSTLELVPLTVNHHRLRAGCHRWARRAGLDPATITPHALRHEAITLALNEGLQLRDVQDYAGHASPDTTRAYDRDANSLDRHVSRVLTSLYDNEEPTP